MEIEKIQYDFETIQIEYSMEQQHAKDYNMIKSKDQPDTSFVEAWHSLVPVILDICDLPEMYNQNFMPCKLEFKRSMDGFPEIKFKAEKKVFDVGDPMKLETMLIPFRYDDSAQYNSERLLDRVNNVADEAVAFVRGRRRQESLFFGIDERAEARIA